MAQRRNRNRNKKQEDETLIDLTQARDQAQGFIETNQNLIFGILVGLVVLVGGYFAYKIFYQQPREAEAIEQMYKAETVFRQDSFAKALTAPGEGYPGFLDIIDTYSGTKAGNLANYYAGTCYLHLGQFEAAKDYLNSYSATGLVTPQMKYGMLGDAHSELGEWDAALSNYKKAAGYDNELTAPYYLHKMALLEEKNGNKDAAIAHFKKIQDQYPLSLQGREVEKYLIRLGAN